jgi:hypothetical protein
LQDALETLALSGFDNLLLPSQNSRYLQRKIKPFQVRNAGFWSHLGSIPSNFLLSVFFKNWDSP